MRLPSHPGNKRLKITGFVTFSSRVFLCLRWRSDCPNSPLIAAVPSPKSNFLVLKFTMKKAILTLFTIAATALAAHAQTMVFSNNFGTGYTNGNLVGQSGWTQTSTATNNPIQILNNQAVLGTSGQDIWKAFDTPVVLSNNLGGYLLTTAVFSINSAQAAGDYFFHLSSPTNTTSFFFQRLYARSATGGFQLGLSVSSTNTTNTLVWGSGILNLSETNTAVLKWDFLAGGSNDPVSVFVNPIGDLLTNTSYATATWGSLEPTNLAALNLRQGTATNAPTAFFDSITVQVVPEPSTYALLALSAAGLAGYAARRRRR